MTTAAPVTKTTALAIARQARRYGHWAEPGDPRAVSVTCPRCGQRVPARREPRQASRGPLYESPGRALDRAMLAHLMEGRCQP